MCIIIFILFPYDVLFYLLIFLLHVVFILTMFLNFQVKLRLLTHNSNVESVLSMYQDLIVKVCDNKFSRISFYSIV